MKKNLLNKKRKSKAFTLVELIIVIAIIAILAAVAVPKYLSIKDKSNIKADVSVAKNLKTVTETLIGDETIALTGSDIDFDVVSGSNPTASPTNGDKVLSLIDNTNIKAKASKLKDGTFHIKISPEGNVTVSVVKDTKSAVVLPEEKAEAPYK